jgi:membrane-bound serine protease (ClpP class)
MNTPKCPSRAPAETSVPRPTVAARAALRLLPLLLLLVPLLSMVAPAAAQSATGGTDAVLVVPITGTIDLGLAPYLDRVLRTAAEEDAAAVVLRIDTPGGRLDAVLQMRDALLASPVETIAFVDRTAFSAGALVALAADEIYMTPGAAMGAATPVDGTTGETASEKVVSAVRTTFAATAEARGRDPRVAEAMVDPNVAIDGLVARGELLTLTANEAITWGYAEGIVADLPALLAATGLAAAPLVETAPSLAERAVRFVTDPVVASLLIAAGVLLIVADAFVAGFGLLGAAGLGLLALFFWGHALAGLTGWEDVALVVLGLVLIAVELFVVPGFGVPGVLGLAALFGGLFLAMLGRDIRAPEGTAQAGLTVAVAFVVVVLGVAALLALLPRQRWGGGLVLQAAGGTGGADGKAGAAARPAPRGWMRWFGSGTTATLADPESSSRPTPVSAPAPTFTPAPPPATTTAAVPVVPPRSLADAVGVAMTDLRPSGIADIGGERIDVVSDGEWIAAGALVRVVRDEGYRRVVRRQSPPPPHGPPAVPA